MIVLYCVLFSCCFGVTYCLYDYRKERKKHVKMPTSPEYHRYGWLASWWLTLVTSYMHNNNQGERAHTWFFMFGSFFDCSDIRVLREFTWIRLDWIACLEQWISKIEHWEGGGVWKVRAEIVVGVPNNRKKEKQLNSYIWKGKVKMRMIWMNDEWQNVWIWLLIASRRTIHVIHASFSFLFAMQTNFIVLYSNDSGIFYINNRKNW